MEKDCCKKMFQGCCCCNCKNQLVLKKHPGNKNFGKGPISRKMGWVCTVRLEDRSNKGTAIYFDTKHGMCELHTKRKKNI